MCGADTVASQATAMDDITWLQAHTNYTYYGTNVTKVCIVVEFLDKHSDIGPEGRYQSRADDKGNMKKAMY